MTASALLEQINKAIDRQQTAIANGAQSFKYGDIQRLQSHANSLMEVISTEGDRNLTAEEQLLYSDCQFIE
ncbi:MAG: hypothetical protein AAB638_00880 [Patescibacteria group bacterium]